MAPEAGAENQPGQYETAASGLKAASARQALLIHPARAFKMREKKQSAAMRVMATQIPSRRSNRGTGSTV